MTADQPPPQPTPGTDTPALDAASGPGPGRSPHDDELVSAVLDGQATAEEQRRVETNPALAARLEQFSGLATALAQPPPTLPAAQGDALVAAAVAAAEGTGAGPPAAAAAPAAPSDALAARRGERARRRLPPMGLVAAALVLMALGAALFLSGRSDHRSSSASRPTGIGGAASEQNDRATTERSQSSAKHAAGGAAPNATTIPAASIPPAAPAVGAFADQDALRSAIKPLNPRTLQPTSAFVPDGSDNPTSVPAPSSPPVIGDQPPGSAAGPTATAAESRFQRCDQVVRASESGLGAPLAFAPAQVGTQGVIVISYPLVADPARVRQYAVDVVSCAPLLAIDR